MSLKQRELITVVGKTGRGKSFLNEKYLVPKIAKNQPVIIADSMAEYSFKSYSFEQLYTMLKNDSFPKNGVFKVDVKDEKTAKKLFAFSALSELKHCLLVEEASKYCSPSKINPHLEKIVAYGRHYGVSAIFVSQRFAQINRLITSQSDFIVSFAQTESNDLKKISKLTDADRFISGLNRREFVAFGDITEHSEFTKELKTGSVLTYDKGKIKQV